MDKLEELNLKIKEKINKNHNIIIIGVFNELIKTHNDFCDCEYCDILRQYVYYKKSISRQKTILILIEHDCCDLTIDKEYNKLDYYKLQADILKEKKDKLKYICK